MEAVLRFAKKDSAEFVLDAATAAGFSVGTDGSELNVVSPHGLPEETKELFYRAFSEHRSEMIELIRQASAA